MENHKQNAFKNIEANYSGDLSFWELMIWGKLLLMIRLSDADFCEYTVPLNDFLSSNTIENQTIISNLSKAASLLLERRIQWTYFDENKHERQFETALLTGVDLLKKQDILSLATNIHPKLKSLLFSLKPQNQPFDFLKLPFLKMSTSHRLYLFVLQNINRNLDSFAIDLEKLKEILDVSGKYSLYANFKIKILEDAQKRLQQDGHLNFDFGEMKMGKKVKAIRFRIDTHPLLPLFENEPNQVVLLPYLPPPIEPEKPPVLVEEITPKPTVDKDLIKKICEKFGVTQRMVKKLSEDFTTESLNQAMILTEKAIEKGIIKGSPAGFFVEAVRQNYQLTEEDETAKRQTEARQKAEIQAQKEEKEREKRENLKKQEFEQERDAILDELEKNNDLRHTIVERIRYSIFHACYDVSKNFKENIENPSFLAAVLNYYKIVKK